MIEKQRGVRAAYRVGVALFALTLGIAIAAQARSAEPATDLTNCATIDECQKKLTKLKDDLDNAIKVYRGVLEDSKNHEKNHENEISKWRANVAVKDHEIIEKSGELLKMQDRINISQGLNKSYGNDIKIERDAVARLESEVLSLRNERDSTKKESENMVTTNESCRKDIDRMKTSMEDDQNRYKAEDRKKSEIISLLEQQKAEATMEIERLKSEIKRLSHPPVDGDHLLSLHMQTMTIKPPRKREYQIGVAPVTVGQWMACVKAKRCPPPGMRDPDALARQPVQAVSKIDIEEKYLKWLSENPPVPGHKYRLPTEEEWTYVARGVKEGRIKGIEGMDGAFKEWTLDCENTGRVEDDNSQQHFRCRVLSFAPKTERINHDYRVAGIREMDLGFRVVLEAPN